MKRQCPCHSGNSYTECCEAYHLGEAEPEPVALMRARYAAYAMNLADYVMQTTHKTHPETKQNKFTWKRGIQQFSKLTDFIGLEILSHHVEENKAHVHFKAILKKNGQDSSFDENSLFLKDKDDWFYAGQS